MNLSEHERVEWVRLARTPRVGPMTFAHLIRRFGSPAAAVAEVPKLARRGGGEVPVLPDEEVIRRECEALEALGGRFLLSCEADFPAGLSALEAPPPLIAVLGDAKLLRREMIAMVGARNASALGRKFATRLAAELGEAGLVVVSGMARGIDAAAHEGALGTGTCAVVAGGLDVVYPPENRALYERLKEKGAVVSEMPLGLPPLPQHFPRRNRIISGLARGTVVVEAAEGSGSLITARMALEQNREIFAVPGSPLDPRAKGTNRLLRQGAVLTETAEDVLTVLKPILANSFTLTAQEPEPDAYQPSEMEADRIREAIGEALGPAPVRVDVLIRLIAVPAPAVLSVLLELELAGKVTRHPGNEVSLSL